MNEINLAPDFIDRTIDAFSRIFNILNDEHTLFLAISIVPVIIWFYIFWRHQRGNKLLALITFLAGMIAVVPIFIFQHEIGRIEGWIHMLGIGAIGTIVVTSLWVGLYEEIAKNWIVRITDRKLFRNIDDAIQLSIITALGFAFVENILYFQSIWHNEAIGNFWFYYTFRSLGSMFLHLFASGIFGYYYGLAHFAKPVLRDKLAQGKRFTFIKKLHRILHMKSETLFHEEKVVEGLLIATALHGVFNFLMGMSQHYTDLDSTFGAKFWLILAVPFLVGGYYWLTYLLDKKENHKMFGEVCERETCDVLDEREAIEKTIEN